MIDAADPLKAQMRAAFDRIAPDYDVAGPQCFAYFGRRLVDQVGIQPDDHVLDLACGRGAVASAALERLGSAGRVTGVDFSEEMVRLARMATDRDARTMFHVMDAEALDFPDASFNALLCGFGVMFFPHLEQALAECRRVLAVGGRLGVSTWQVSQAEDVRAVLDDMGIPGTGEPTWVTDPSALASLLSRAGFADVQVRIDAHPFRYVSLDEYLATARGTGQRRRLDALTPEQTADLERALTRRFADRSGPDGLSIEARALLATARR